MKNISLTILLTLFATSLLAQCDCDKIDQNNGTFYTLCKPFMSGNDSIGEIKVGISGLGPHRYIHVTISFKSNPQIINGALTIQTKEGKSWRCVMIQRDKYTVDSVQTSYGLFASSTEEMALMQNDSVKSITIYLFNGKTITVNMTYLPTDLTKQIECLKE